MKTGSFASRHIGVTIKDIEKMLSVVGADSMATFIDKVVPTTVRTKKKLDISCFQKHFFK